MAEIRVRGDGTAVRKLKKYKQTRFMAKGSHYDKEAADYAVAFIESLCHTKGKWAGKKFELIDWQEQIVRDLFGTIKENGYRQFNQAYIEIPKKQGKSELAAAVKYAKATAFAPISEKEIPYFTPNYKGGSVHAVE